MLLFKINKDKNLKKQSEDILKNIKNYYGRFERGEFSEEELRRKESWDGYMRKVHNLD